MTTVQASLSAQTAAGSADLERRFSGLRRLYGDDGYKRVRSARVAVVGLGGVGSWVVEALARSGVASLVLFDLDHVAESNINRQVQALGASVGQAKAQALRERVADIHPGCHVVCVEDFVQPGNWPALLPEPVDVLIDACDQVRAKHTLADWAWHSGTAFVTVGAAGGKLQPQAVEVADLAQTTHDPLLASLRQRWRQGLRRAGHVLPTGDIGLRCVFSREAVRLPVPVNGDVDAAAPGPSAIEAAATDGSLNCHGYGSSVTVTATFGMVAAAEALAQLLMPSKAVKTGQKAGL
jgi:tRNA threonylcarbamoyladenosine dehydratase